MIERLHRNFVARLAHLLQLDSRQQLRSILAIALFALLFNVLSNWVYDQFKLQPWILFLSLFVALVIWLWGTAPARPVMAAPPRMTRQPARHRGMIWMLGLFNAPHPTRAWRIEQLHDALAKVETANADQMEQLWEEICKRVKSSNMEPLIEAIRYHVADGALRHLWLISTHDVVDEANPTINQSGSVSLAPLLQKVLTTGFGFNLNIYFANEKLQVNPDDIGTAYDAVEFIYEHDCKAVGLSETDVIADVTGGRVPMSGGMILACAPRNWAMQYTTTLYDPVLKVKDAKPVPYQLAVTSDLLLQKALETAVSQFRRSNS